MLVGLVCTVAPGLLGAVAEGLVRFVRTPETPVVSVTMPGRVGGPTTAPLVVTVRWQLAQLTTAMPGLVTLLVMTRSSFPSLLKSPTAPANAFPPGVPGDAKMLPFEKVPLPLLTRIVT